MALVRMLYFCAAHFNIHALCHFCTHLARCTSYIIIKVYLSALCLEHLECGHHNPTDDACYVQGSKEPMEMPPDHGYRSPSTYQKF